MRCLDWLFRPISFKLISSLNKGGQDSATQDRHSDNTSPASSLLLAEDTFLNMLHHSQVHAHFQATFWEEEENTRVVAHNPHGWILIP